MVNQKDKVQGKVQKGIYLLMNGAVTFVCTDSRVVGVMSNFPESCFSRSEVGRQGEDLMVEQNICVWDFCSRRAEESQVRMPNTWGIIRAGKRSQDLSWKKSSLRQGGLEFTLITPNSPSYRIYKVDNWRHRCHRRRWKCLSAVYILPEKNVLLSRLVLVWLYFL